MNPKGNTKNAENFSGNQQGGNNQNPGNLNQKSKTVKQCDNLLDL